MRKQAPSAAWGVSRDGPEREPGERAGGSRAQSEAPGHGVAAPRDCIARHVASHKVTGMFSRKKLQ